MRYSVLDQRFDSGFNRTIFATAPYAASHFIIMIIICLEQRNKF